MILLVRLGFIIGYHGSSGGDLSLSSLCVLADDYLFGFLLHFGLLWNVLLYRDSSLFIYLHFFNSAQIS